MLSDRELEAAAARIAAAASRPAKVIVFGSYGRGDANEDSDLDLLVIESELPDPGGEYLRLRDAVGHIGVGVDLVVFTTHDFERRRQVRSTLPYWASKEGRVLHDPAA